HLLQRPKRRTDAKKVAWHHGNDPAMLHLAAAPDLAPASARLGVERHGALLARIAVILVPPRADVGEPLPGRIPVERRLDHDLQPESARDLGFPLSTRGGAQ